MKERVYTALQSPNLYSK